MFFLLFVSVASTLFLPGYLIYRRFDRNRAAALTAVLRKMLKAIGKYNRDAEAKLDLAFGCATRTTTSVNTYELFNKADKEM